ncbi:hypothetical protein KJ684_02495 [Patescibacteria group bacterium]|nr:hypothetical protein [Patescibacteria group bacterium]
MKKKNTTIDDLTIMVKKGFDGSDKKIDNLTKEIRSSFKEVDKRFDKIENLILADHKRRI